MAILVGDGFARRQAIAEIDASAKASSELLVASLERELGKYRLASLVLAQDADALAILNGERGERLRSFNVKLEGLSAELGVPVYLINRDGTALASSNWRSPQSWVGQNYRFRAYFREALARGSYEQFALGIISLRPGLYIARRLSVDGRALGVIVAKVEFDALEAEWRKAGVTAFASDPSGVILVTNDPATRFKTIKALDPATQQRNLTDLVFGEQPLEVLPLYAQNSVRAARDPKAATAQQIETLTPLANGWTLHVLRSTQASLQPAVTRNRLAVVTGMMILLTLFMIYFYVRRTQAYRAERLLAEQQRLMNERLVQLNKLAALGQIAAGVGHEINQPLTAITAYASNAQDFLTRGDTTSVRENLGLIGQLASRIGAITGELLGFARKATGTTSDVQLSSVVEGALLLMRDAIATAGATVKVPKLDDMVRGEAVRLEQVLVNLIQNALETGQKGMVITLDVTQVDGFIELTVADNGPGLSEAARATLFQPFSTTKRDGLGLGLVISRDIMSDLGGELVALSPSHGAAFAMRMRPAP